MSRHYINYKSSINEGLRTYHTSVADYMQKNSTWQTDSPATK